MAQGSGSGTVRNGLGLYSALVIGGIAMNATQMLVIAIIMPTIVHDIGGTSFYTWAAMLYTIGSIVGGASTGMVWSRLGARRAYTLGVGIFALGTVCCALAPNIGWLIAARGVQGWAGALVSGSGMALITSLFDTRLRTRIIAISQGTFTACHLSGPIVGGMFAAMQWWRGCDDLQLRTHRRGRRDARRGLLPGWQALVGAAARERRQAPRNAGAPQARSFHRRVSRRCRDPGGRQEPPLPLRDR